MNNILDSSGPLTQGNVTCVSCESHPQAHRCLSVCLLILVCGLFAISILADLNLELFDYHLSLYRVSKILLREELVDTLVFVWR